MRRSHRCGALRGLLLIRRASRLTCPCETVSATAHTCGLDGKDKVGGVAAVEEWHETLLASEALVDKQILLVVAHRVAEIDRFHLPSVAFKLVDDHENPTCW